MADGGFYLLSAAGQWQRSSGGRDSQGPEGRRGQVKYRGTGGLHAILRENRSPPRSSEEKEGRLTKQVPSFVRAVSH
jgi:hypothetical protein